MLKNIHMIPDMEHIEESLELAFGYQACFEYNDFFLPQVLANEEETEKKIQFYCSLNRDRSKDTLHGAFLDVTIHSQDEKIRAVSKERVRQSLSIAKRLGIRGVVFHANLIAGFYDENYLNGWLQTSVNFYKEMLAEFPELEIYIENMFEARPDELKRLAEAMKDEERFGICLDYAHAVVFGKDAKLWVQELAPYIKHMHINDNDLHNDKHWQIGMGQIDWQEFAGLMEEYQLQTSVLIEVRGNKVWKESFEYLQDQSLILME